MADENLGLAGVAWRFLFALALVLLTFNPSGYSFYHWAAQTFPKVQPVVALAGIALLIGWIVFFNATLQSLGTVGVVLTAAFFAALVWVALDYGWLQAGNGTLLWIGLLVLAAILAMGMSWSHIRRRLSGQAAVDQVDNH